MAAADELAIDGKVDTNNLYRQETYTDMGFGTIQCLIPITVRGDEDKSRSRVFMGSAQIMTPHGPIPVQSEINATDLQSACEAFPGAIQGAVQELLQQAREFERERQGGIVIPRGGKLELP